MLMWKCEYCGHSVEVKDASHMPAGCELCSAGLQPGEVKMDNRGVGPGVGPVSSGPVGNQSGNSSGGHWNGPGGPIARCSRLVYIVLAIVLGWLGIHNFVAGYSNRGAWQLGLGLAGAILFPCTFGISAVLIIAVSVWAIVDIIQTTTDADGVRML
jgi:TM2 domain-containing membrane protein YozV